MDIYGLENLSPQQLEQEIARGGKFVVFEYCISLLIVTFKRSTDVYFIRAGESTFSKSFTYTLLSAVVGWWGFPWGPIYTIAALHTNLSGGKNVTMEIINALNNKPNHTILS